jgi:hypothetical protein
MIEDCDFGVDEVHDKIDAFMLSIFEAIRAHELLEDPEAPKITEEKLGMVASSYKEAIHAIDHMTGIHDSKASQEKRLLEQSKEAVTLKQSILSKESELLEKKKALDAQLQAAFNDEALKFPSSEI